MVDFIHQNRLKLILWQIPVLKYFEISENEQHALDEAYAIEKGYCVLNEDGTPYRITDGWFKNSLLLDFNNLEAKEWWFAKRRYLIDDLKVDGFKTDGGEFIFDDRLRFHDGMTGLEMRNRYPVSYIEAYHQFGGKERITFSRAGFTGAQKYPLYWGGDQISTFRTLKSLMIAGLSMNISGNPFWGWDIAGFSGEVPTAELFIRSAQMAAFCPVMQFHSESRGEFNRDRSPWNIAARTGDPRVIEIYRKFANLRMNLLPYIYNEAIYVAKNGEPMMRPLFFDSIDDEWTYNIEDEYLFGRSLLVAPVTEEGRRRREVYLLAGEWTDFWSGVTYVGNCYLNYLCDLEIIPVFIRRHAVVSLNLNDAFKLGESVGNDLLEYQNLCFWVNGPLETRYEFEDDLGNQIVLEKQKQTLKMNVTGSLSRVYLIAEEPLVAGGRLIGQIPGKNGLMVYEVDLNEKNDGHGL